MTKITNKSPLTQGEIKKRFKARAMKAFELIQKKGLAPSQILIAFYPEYAEQKILIGNVGRGMSYDESITLKLEECVERLTKK